MILFILCCTMQASKCFFWGGFLCYDTMWCVAMFLWAKTWPKHDVKNSKFQDHALVQCMFRREEWFHFLGQLFFFILSVFLLSPWMSYAYEFIFESICCDQLSYLSSWRGPISLCTCDMLSVIDCFIDSYLCHIGISVHVVV